MELIIKFLVLTAFVSGVIIFFLHRTLVSSTEGAVKRLDDEIDKAKEKQAELSKKIKEADEELEKRQTEAKALADKMRTDAQEETKNEREEIVSKARAEGEEIIAKAQNAKEKMKEELEKENDMKVLDFSAEILTSVLSDKAKGSLNTVLLEEFLTNLQNVDMSRIGVDVTTAEVVTVAAIDDTTKQKIAQVIKDKIGRDISISGVTDEKLGGGAVLKFGSMALDGSLKNSIREKVNEMQEQVEARV